MELLLVWWQADGERLVLTGPRFRVSWPRNSDTKAIFTFLQTIGPNTSNQWHAKNSRPVYKKHTRISSHKVHFCYWKESWKVKCSKASLYLAIFFIETYCNCTTTQQVNEWSLHENQSGKEFIIIICFICMFLCCVIVCLWLPSNKPTAKVFWEQKK